MSARENWLLGFGLFFGLPGYFSGIPFGTAFLIHLGFIAVYVLLLRDFGGDSCIEMGVVLSFTAIALSVIVSLGFQSAELKKQRELRREQRRELQQRELQRQSIKAKTPTPKP